VLRLGLRPDWLLASATWIDRHVHLLAQLQEGADPAGTFPLRLRLVSEEVLAAVATTAQPDGVAPTLPLNQLPQPRSWPTSDGQPGDRPGTETQFPRVDGLVLALDRLQDPGNLGTLLRCALAAGVDEVWLAGGADPHQPKVLRASAGAALAMPLRRLQDLAPALALATREGCQVVATVVAPQGRHPGRHPGRDPAQDQGKQRTSPRLSGPIGSWIGASPRSSCSAMRERASIRP
jgi:TrmH family RNA methyltransferase